MLIKPGHKIPGRVVAVFHLAVFHGGDLHDAGQVSARTNGNNHVRQLHTQYSVGLLTQTQAIVKFAVLPLLQLDHQVDLRVKLHRTHTEELLHINDAHAADLNIVANQLRGSAVKRGGNAAYLHSVVRHQAVAALEQLNGGLTLADA